MDLEAARRALLGAAESLAAAVGRMVAVDSSDDEGIGPRSATMPAMEERGRRGRRRKSKQQQPGVALSPPRVRGSKSDASLSSYYDAVPEEEGEDFDSDGGGEDDEDNDDDNDDGVLVPRRVRGAEGASAPQEQAMFREPVAAAAAAPGKQEDEQPEEGEEEEDEEAQPQDAVAKRASGFGFGWFGFGGGGNGGGRDDDDDDDESGGGDDEARRRSSASTSRSSSRSRSPSPSPSPPPLPTPPRYVPATPLPVLPAGDAPPMSDASPLLSPADAAALASAGLPARLRFCGWRLAYSTARDGTSLSTLYRAAAAAAAGAGSGPVFPGGGGSGGGASAAQEASPSLSSSCLPPSPQRPPAAAAAAAAATAASSSSNSVGTGAGGPSVLVVRDRGGAVFGCFASEPWGPPRPRYFGNGESFVFSLKPERGLWRWHAARCAVEVPAWALDEEAEKEEAEKEKEESGGGEGKGASGGDGNATAAAPTAASRSTETRTTPRNDFFQLARPTSLALGGGPRFALSLDADLARGRSGACETFGCARGLASEEEFDVGRVELWSLH